ncbi:hypothetical protein BJ165DRAFT_1546858 [Panaeolus papilionaceus]|nr:hypothetical protein BJ165DRAFT_1546858 [Panaeolus papilionaceus]
MSYKWDDEEVVLHYLNSTTAEHILQEVFGIIPASTPRYIQFGVEILLETLREMGEAQIKWPRRGIVINGGDEARVTTRDNVSEPNKASTQRPFPDHLPKRAYLRFEDASYGLTLNIEELG